MMETTLLKPMPAIVKDLAPKAGILFTMRYPDDTGYVWNYIAGIRDRASAHLLGRAVPYMAFPKLTGTPSYMPRYLRPVELDCYDNSAAGRAAIEKFVRAHDIKVVVFMSALPQTVCLDLLRRLGVRTLNTEDDGFDPQRRDGIVKRSLKYLVRRLLGRQQHDLHLANSAAQQDFLLNYQQLPPARIALMKNAIDCDHFSPGSQIEARRQTGLAPDRFWILAVSQARSEKRVDQLIRVISQVAKARPEARIGFVYVGDGVYVDEWKQLARELGIGDICVFAGQRHDVRPYYQAADMLVHASEIESFGLVIVEAMACGRPVIASAAAGPRETIRDGVTGALVGLDDFDAFAQTIVRYVDDRAMTETHGRNARAHVAATYNVRLQERALADHITRFL